MAVSAKGAACGGFRGQGVSLVASWAFSVELWKVFLEQHGRRGIWWRKQLPT